MLYTSFDDYQNSNYNKSLCVAQSVIIICVFVVGILIGTESATDCVNLTKLCNNTFKDIIYHFLIYINIKHVDRYKR